MVVFHYLFQNQTFAPELLNEESKRHRVYLRGRQEGTGRVNYYVIRSRKGCKRRKEIAEACGITERIQGMRL